MVVEPCTAERMNDFPPPFCCYMCHGVFLPMAKAFMLAADKFGAFDSGVLELKPRGAQLEQWLPTWGSRCTGRSRSLFC